MANPVQNKKPVTPAKKVLTVPKPIPSKPKPAPKSGGFMNALGNIGKTVYTYSGAKDIVKGGQKIAQSGILPGGKKADWGQAALGLGQTALGAAGFIPGAGFAVRAGVGGAKALSAGSKVLKATRPAQTVARTPAAKAAASAATRVGSAARPAVSAVKKPLATAAKPLVKVENYLNKGLLKGTGKPSKILNATVANKGTLAILASQAIPGLVSGYNEAMAEPTREYQTRQPGQYPKGGGKGLKIGPNVPAPINSQPPAAGNPPAQGMPPAANPPASTPEVPTLENPLVEGNVPTTQDPTIDEGVPTLENPMTGGGIPTLENPLTEQSMGETTMQYAPNAANYLMQSEDMQAQGAQAQGMNQGSGPFTAQGTPGGTGAAPLLGAAQVAGMNYKANLAQAAATANINDAGIREALSQRLMGAQGGAADIIGGRAAGILGQGITGARRSYVTEKSSEAQRALQEQDALRRQYGSELSEAYKAQAEKVLEAAKARSEAAAQIRRYGVA